MSARTRQRQKIAKQAERIERFSRTQFIGHVTDKITFNRNGDMMIVVQVPFQFKHLAMPLTDAFGIPLSFDVEVWAPFNGDSDDGKE